MDVQSAAPNQNFFLIAETRSKTFLRAGALLYHGNVTTRPLLGKLGLGRLSVNDRGSQQSPRLMRQETILTAIKAKKQEIPARPTDDSLTSKTNPIYSPEWAAPFGQQPTPSGFVLASPGLSRPRSELIWSRVLAQGGNEGVGKTRGDFTLRISPPYLILHYAIHV